MAASIESADGDIGFQIAPMVDVVFVLMLFFMASTGAQVLTKELHASLSGPKHPSGEVLPAIVEISADGGVSFNGETLGTPLDTQLTGLRERFALIRREFGAQGKDH